jgi:hypothetical protein
VHFAAAVIVLAVGCGKQLNAEFCGANPSDERCAADEDASIDDDALTSDALAIASRIYVSTSSGDLYGVEPATMDVQLIGTTDDPDAPGDPLVVNALGFNPDGTLVGVTDDNHLIRIDATNATVLSKVAVAESLAWVGLTVAPPGALAADAMVLVATEDTMAIYEVRTDGSLRDIGPLGSGLRVAGDLAWVPDVGLFASVLGSGCSNTCIARVSPTTGVATLISIDGPGELWAMAAFGTELWAIGGSDQAYVVDQTSGATTPRFSTSISGVTDAAP